jgi:hypothetical protein
MPQEPKRPASELKPAELRTIVGEIQKLLWLDEYATDEQRSNGGCTSFWNADKEWQCADILSAIATVFDDHGLKPIDPPVVTGTTHKLDYEDEPIPEDYSDSEDPDDWIGGDNAAG